MKKFNLSREGGEAGRREATGARGQGAFERETEARVSDAAGSYRAPVVLPREQLHQVVDQIEAQRGRRPLAVEFLRRDTPGAPVSLLSRLDVSRARF